MPKIVLSSLKEGETCTFTAQFKVFGSCGLSPKEVELTYSPEVEPNRLSSVLAHEIGHAQTLPTHKYWESHVARFGYLPSELFAWLSSIKRARTLEFFDFDLIKFALLDYCDNYEDKYDLKRMIIQIVQSFRKIQKLEKEDETEKV
jgi:hypothetical protein